MRNRVLLIMAVIVANVGCGASHQKPTGPAPEYEEPELKMAVPTSTPAASRISGPAAAPAGDAGHD